MSDDPLRRKPGKGRPAIWTSGGQRPPFDLRALGRATLHLSRAGVAPIHAWAARGLRRAAINVKNGVGRIPAGKLGRAERFVPSHLRVAAWVKTLAATLSHASATADEDVARGNALVAEIAPHLWEEASPAPEPAPVAEPSEAPPVTLPEPKPVEDDPLASIRGDLGGKAKASAPATPIPPAAAPAPPGPLAEGAIQVSGYLIGWATVLVALPYGLGRSLWLWANGRDLKTIGPED